MHKSAFETHVGLAGRAAGLGALLAAASSVLGLGCGDPAASGPNEQRNIQDVTEVMLDGVLHGDTEVIQRLVRKDYIQHSLQVGDGRAGMLASIQERGPTPVKIHRILAEGDFVAVHASYGTDNPATPTDERTVAFDVYRLEDGLLAEHWDARSPAVAAAASVSGRSMVDGAVDVTDPEQTENNRRIVTEFVQLVFTQGHFELLDTYLADPYYQHDPLAGDGIAGIQAFVAQATEMGLRIGYTSSPLVVADGNFVLVGSEGYLGPAADPPFAVFYDLWRLEGGKMVEHWDLIPPLPSNLSSLPHDNGIFCPRSPCTIP